jgi:hypothetical protein
VPKDSLYDAAAQEVDTARRAERLQRARDAWDAWVAWWKRRARELAVAAKVSAALAAIAGSWKAIGLLRARDVGRPEDQANGVQTVATGFVDKRPPHDAGPK